MLIMDDEATIAIRNGEVINNQYSTIAVTADVMETTKIVSKK
jgi:hypothetical protein